MQSNAKKNLNPSHKLKRNAWFLILIGQVMTGQGGWIQHEVTTNHNDTLYMQERWSESEGEDKGQEVERGLGPGL